MRHFGVLLCFLVFFFRNWTPSGCYFSLTFLIRFCLSVMSLPSLTMRGSFALSSIPRPSLRSQCRIVAGQRRNITIKQLEAAKNGMLNFILPVVVVLMISDRERVVILGSGWGGYNLARKLNPNKFQTVVVSPRSYFVFTPLLASTSVGTLEFRAALEPVRTRKSKYEYIQGRADAVDFASRQIMVRETVRCPK